MSLHIEGQHPLERVEAAVDTIEDYLFENQEEFDIRSVYSYYEKGHAETVMLLTEEDLCRPVTTEEVQSSVAALLAQLES